MVRIHPKTLPPIPRRERFFFLFSFYRSGLSAASFVCKSLHGHLCPIRPVPAKTCEVNQPLTAPVTMPSMIFLENAKYRTTIGSMVISMPAMIFG